MSAFWDKGKFSGVKLSLTDISTAAKHCSTLKQPERNVGIEEDDPILSGIEEFECVMYGHPTVCSVIMLCHKHFLFPIV